MKTWLSNRACFFQFLEEANKIYPLGRVGEVEDIASTIAFLASDSASFITGASIPVDGGYCLAGPR